MELGNSEKVQITEADRLLELLGVVGSEQVTLQYLSVFDKDQDSSVHKVILVEFLKVLVNPYLGRAEKTTLLYNV